MTLFNLFLISWGLQLLNFNNNNELKKLLQYSMFLGILGPIVEGYYSGVIGFFTYSDIDAYYVPLWLCGLYLNGGITVAVTMSKLIHILHGDDTTTNTNTTTKTKNERTFEKISNNKLNQTKFENKTE